MKPFRLDKVLDYRKHLRVEARNALAAALADERTLLDNRAKVGRQKKTQMDQLSSFTRSDVINVEAAARRRYFTGQLDIQIMILDEQLAQARHIVELRRTTLVTADQEVKALERLRETHVAEEVASDLRRTEIELGEQWQSSNWKW
ncbi:MAG: flagellar FliJ family protein [Planctomycetota bacterium]|nr:flagellar FliJ family protein [Planctomycetota bacterium]MDA1162070.1 flagellar FliJ family protein [Planctomycetota bacterium]